MVKTIWQRYHEGIVLGVVLLVSFFVGLGGYALENINEGLYGEIPREMLLRGDYIIPHLNYVPYIEKPPLLYWLTALSYQLFGVSEFTARLVPAISAASVCIVMRNFARKLNLNHTGYTTALMLASSVGMILLARILIFDMLLCALLTACFTQFYYWYSFEHQYYIRMAYVFAGLAVMTKGLMILVLLPAVVLSFLLWQRAPWQRFRAFFDLVGITLFLMITLPWHVAASIAQPEFSWQYFINEHVLRFLDAREPHDYHTGPWWFYLPRVVVYLLPWSLLLPFVFNKAKETSLTRFLWCWFLVPLVFFSLSQAKGDYYMVLGVPALAMLISYKAIDAFKSREVWLLLGVLGFVLLEMLFLSVLVSGAHSEVVAQYLPRKMVLEPYIADAMQGLLINLLVICVVGVFITYRFRHNIKVVVSLLAMVMLAPAQFLVKDKNLLQAKYSEKMLVQEIKQPLPIYLFQDYEDLSSLVYYTGQRIKIIDNQSRDLDFGSHTPEAKGWFVDLAKFKNTIKKEKNYVVMKDGKELWFKQQVAPEHYCKVVQSGGTVLLTNDVNLCRNVS